MKIPFFLLPAAFLFAGPANAEDARIATRFYDASNIVSISGQIGIQSTIEFAADESIENVALGDSSAWQVTPNRRANLLFLKPVLANGRTNMTVVTSKRTYLFDLLPQAKGRSAFYILRFTYPEPIVPLGEVTAKPKVEEVAKMDSTAAMDPTKFNFAWVGQGKARLLPQKSFDDGQSLYLSWDKDIELPAILTVGPEGVEGPVNFTNKGEFIVVDGVPAKVIFRAGKEMASLKNTAAIAPPKIALQEGE